MRRSGRARQKWIMRVLLIVGSILGTACSSPPPAPPPPPDHAAAAARQLALPQDIADRAFPSPLAPSDAEQNLLATRVFDVAEHGFPPGRQVHAFNVLLDQPDAHDRFRRLASKGQAAGRLYALCGLLVVARKEGITFAHSLSLQPGDVTIRQGDSGSIHRPCGRLCSCSRTIYRSGCSRCAPKPLRTSMVLADKPLHLRRATADTIMSSRA